MMRRCYWSCQQMCGTWYTSYGTPAGGGMKGAVRAQSPPAGQARAAAVPLVGANALISSATLQPQLVRR
jgi:hypothetical protein